MKIALIQLSAGIDKIANLSKAMAMTAHALAKGANFVLLPEVFNFRGNTRELKTIDLAVEKIPGPSVDSFSKIAKKNYAYILLGSLLEKAPKSKAYNTSVLINPAGKVAAKYRKIHLFDARLGDQVIREAECFSPGQHGVVVGVEKFMVGLSICYDVRFSDLYARHARQGANVLTVPAAFSQQTGQAHWEVLLRARAIENLAYVLAPNQVGCDYRGIKAYGNSMIIGPWGEVIARGSDSKEEIVYGQIDIKEVERVRHILPGVVRKNK